MTRIRMGLVPGLLVEDQVVWWSPGAQRRRAGLLRPGRRRHSARGVQLQELPELGTVDGWPTSPSRWRPGSPTPTTTGSGLLPEPVR